MPLLRLAFALLLAALVPPAATALLGGADLDLPGGFRVSWFEATPLWLGAAAALAAATLDDRGRRLARGLLAVAAVVLLVLAYVGWGGRIRTPWLRVTDLWRPALESVGAVALAVLAGARPSRRTLAGPVVALAAGALATLAFFAADRTSLERRVAVAREAASGRDVIFVLVDTLRADALGVYGAEPSPSPWIDAMARRGVVFEHALSQAAWTYPSVASFMTSRQPGSLQLHEELARDGDRIPALDASVPRLAAWLQGLGWRTAGYYKNPFLGPGSGIETGFDVWEHVGGKGTDLPSAGWIVDATLGWARAFAARRAAGDRHPYFLYLHFMEPHLDYRPPRAFWPPEALAYDGPMDGTSRRLHKALRKGAPLAAADLAFLRSLYRGEVAYLDTELRRLEEALRAEGLWTDETVFVLTADHGEQIGEHGEFEHGDVHAVNVHVPLVFDAPGLAPRSVPDLVRLLDVTPTLLALAGAPALPGAQGRSLVPLLHGEPLPPLPVLTEHGTRLRITTPALSLLRKDDRRLLYDWLADPREERDLAAERPADVAALEAALEALRPEPAEGPRASDRALDPETLEQLRALGYL